MRNYGFADLGIATISILFNLPIPKQYINNVLLANLLALCEGR